MAAGLITICSPLLGDQHGPVNGDLPDSTAIEGRGAVSSVYNPHHMTGESRFVLAALQVYDSPVELKTETVLCSIIIVAGSLVVPGGMSNDHRLRRGPFDLRQHNQSGVVRCIHPCSYPGYWGVEWCCSPNIVLSANPRAHKTP